MARPTSDTRFKLQPADPFDLIRWLARTQNDPRKAVELVQNSIDAGGTCGSNAVDCAALRRS